MPPLRSAPVVSPIGLKNDLCNNSGRFSPRINLQWLTMSAALARPFGISRASSCVSVLFIFGAELNEPILCTRERTKCIDWSVQLSQVYAFEQLAMDGHVSTQQFGTEPFKQFDKDKYRNTCILYTVVNHRECERIWNRKLFAHSAPYRASACFCIIVLRSFLLDFFTWSGTAVIWSNICSILAGVSLRFRTRSFCTPHSIATHTRARTPDQ